MSGNQQLQQDPSDPAKWHLIQPQQQQQVDVSNLLRGQAVYQILPAMKTENSADGGAQNSSNTVQLVMPRNQPDNLESLGESVRYSKGMGNACSAGLKRQKRTACTCPNCKANEGK